MIKDNNRANQLQFLRFIAFFVIFIWHCGGEGYHIKGMPNIESAYCAVSFFFILSGFVTGYSSYGKEYKLNFKEILKELWKKIKRFYPLYIGVTLCMAIISGMSTNIANYNLEPLKNEIGRLIRNILLMQSWFTQNYFDFSGVGWFLSSIMFLYIFNIPFKVLLNRIDKKIENTKSKCVTLILLFSVVIVAIILYSYIIRNADLQFFNYIFPPARLGEYLSGMISGFMIAMILNNVNRNKVLKERNTKIVYTMLEILVLIFWLIMMYIEGKSAWQARIVRWLLPNFALILVFSIGHGYLSKLFENKYLKMLGDISFECYLLHQMILRIYTKSTKFVNTTLLGRIFSIVVCLLITIILAYIIHGRPLREQVNKNSK